MNSLTIKFRNMDFGPIPGGKFLQAQVVGVKQFGIGDQLFVPPRSYQGIDQFGYEDMVRAAVDIKYKDGTQQSLEQGIPIGYPGIETEGNIELSEDKRTYDIDYLVVKVVTDGFGHSRSGGGGFSANTRYPVEIGLGLITAQRIRSEPIIVTLSLSARWDISKDPNQLDLDEHEFVKLNFLKTAAAQQANWQPDCTITSSWRAALAPYWQGNPGCPDGYKWSYPMGVLEPGMQGWLVGANHGGLTDTQQKHTAAFRIYRDHLEQQLKNVEVDLEKTPITDPKADHRWAQRVALLRYLGDVWGQKEHQVKAKVSPKLDEKSFQQTVLAEEDRMPGLISYAKACPNSLIELAGQEASVEQAVSPVKQRVTFS